MRFPLPRKSKVHRRPYPNLHLSLRANPFLPKKLQPPNLYPNLALNGLTNPVPKEPRERWRPRCTEDLLPKPFGLLNRRPQRVRHRLRPIKNALNP